MALNDLVNIGLNIASDPNNLIRTPGGRQVFEAAIFIAQQEVLVRVVLNSKASLRSVHIKNRLND